MNKKKQILIVEDESIVAMDIRRIVQNLDYDVSAIVSSGQAAIHEAQQNHPDLVLMDIMLKGPMDGIEAAAQIHSDLGIPVIYLTAHTEDTTLGRAITTEPFGYLIKPFKGRELKAAIEVAICLANSEKNLKNTKASFHNVVERSSEGIVVVDEIRKVKFINPMAEIMFGLKSEQVIGETLEFPVTAGETPEVEIALSDGTRGVGEMHTVDIEWYSKPAYLVSVRDVTKRKKIKDELTEKIHSLEVFRKAAVGRELKMIELKEEIADRGLRMTELKNKIAELEAELVKK